MSVRGQERRQALVSAAAEGFHRHGMQGTALADVARAADVAPGNMFTYFRTKDALSQAVGEHLVERIRGMTAELDSISADPLTRVRLLLNRSADNGAHYAELGCPLASLARDVRQMRSSAVDAAAPFRVLIAWVTEQMAAAGDRQAERHALFLVAAMQGAFVLAHAEERTATIDAVTAMLDEWLGLNIHAQEG